MPIRLTIVVDKGVARIKTDWKNVNNKTIRDFCKLLLNLQNGQCSDQLIKSVEITSKEDKNKEVGKKIVKQLLKQENFLDSPIVEADELGRLIREDES